MRRRHIEERTNRTYPRANVKALTKTTPIIPRMGKSEPNIALPVPGSIYASATRAPTEVASSHTSAAMSGFLAHEQSRDVIMHGQPFDLIRNPVASLERAPVFAVPCAAEAVMACATEGPSS